jgi:phosphohistidine phosphatase SixA
LNDDIGIDWIRGTGIFKEDSMKTYIYFVRHAKSPFVPSIDQERVRGLTEQGKRDAAKVCGTAMEASGIIDSVLNSITIHK